MTKLPRRIMMWQQPLHQHHSILLRSFLVFACPPLCSLLEEKAKQNPQKGNYKRKSKEMLPEQWAQPCGSQCTQKYAALTQIPWRVFCKKGCGSDGETWEECLAECNEICYKDPVFKDQQWSAYIDRSPGAAGYSEECFHACVAGCGYKFNIHPEKVGQVRPNRPCKAPPAKPPVQRQPPSAVEPGQSTEDIPCTSA